MIIRQLLICYWVNFFEGTSSIFIIESISKASSKPRIEFYHFLPSFMKSYTISMHHAAIITPGIVALRHLDNFIEVFIMVSIIFTPFLIMRSITSVNSIDQVLSCLHGLIKLTNIIVAIVLRTHYARNISKNIKFSLNSFDSKSYSILFFYPPLPFTSQY